MSVQIMCLWDPAPRRYERARTRHDRDHLQAVWPGSLSLEWGTCLITSRSHGQTVTLCKTQGLETHSFLNTAPSSAPYQSCDLRQGAHFYATKWEPLALPGFRGN